MVYPSKDYFLYFAYGSNLLKRRIRINNPSAQFVGVGLLENHQLDFVKYFESWGGSAATIIPKDNEKVWGAIWKMDRDAITTLDKQEGVESKEYFPKTVSIITPNGKKTECRTYQHTFSPPFRKSSELLPEDRRPSITYQEVLVRGAIECHLPLEYVDMLKKLPNNGKYASPEIRKLLDL